MKLLDKVLINLHRGSERLKQGAAVLSDRVKFEMNIVRMRIRINEIRRQIEERYILIGRRAAELHGAEQTPGSFEEFLGRDEIAAALGEIEKLVKEIDEINADLKREQAEVVEAVKQSGEPKT